jgi:alpha-beta hydrolase superfamily lysophospholipase
VPARPVEFVAADGLVLRGQRYGKGERWAVLVHDEGQDLDAWRSLVADLCALGLCALGFDLRGHGASDDPWDPEQASSDVLAALRFAGSQGADSLYLLGAGLGATAALAAAGRHEVRAIVAFSPRRELPGIRADALREARAPKLLVVGGLDPAAAAEAEEVHRRSIGWAVLQSPPVEAQGTGLLASEWGEQVAEHTLLFLRDYL